MFIRDYYRERQGYNEIYFGVPRGGGQRISTSTTGCLGGGGRGGGGGGAPRWPRVAARDLNTTAHRFNALFGCAGSEGTDALRQEWGVGVSFALPSFHVIDEILDVVERDNATVILIVPAWASRPWWAHLWSAAWAARRTAYLELPVDGLVANAPGAFFLRDGGRGFMCPLWAVRLDALPAGGGAGDDLRR